MDRDIFVKSVGMREITGERAHLYVPEAVFCLVAVVFAISTSTYALDLKHGDMDLWMEQLTDCPAAR